jgi:hypothetical protein
MRAVLGLKRHSTIQRTVLLAPPEEIRKVTNQCAYDTFEWALSQGANDTTSSVCRVCVVCCVSCRVPCAVRALTAMEWTRRPRQSGDLSC